MEYDEHEAIIVQLGIIGQRLGHIEETLAELKPILVHTAVLENRVAVLEQICDHGDITQVHSPKLADHEARIEACECEIKSLGDRSWQIIAGMIMLIIGAVISVLKGDI